MKARQLICGAAYPPETLKVVFQAFDHAWAEIAPRIGSEPGAVEMARLSLAEIALSLAKTEPIEHDGLKNSAVAAFRIAHRLK